MRCVYLAASRKRPSVRLFRAAPSVLSTLSRIRRSAASAKTSRTPAAVPLKWCQNFAMRRCFEMHILPKRCKRETASWPGPHAGGDVISLVLREMQGPARGVDSRAIIRTPSRRPRHVRGPNGLRIGKETILSRRRLMKMA